MAAGDNTPTTWVNNTTPAINQTNLNRIEDKIEEIDNLLKRTNTIDFKDIREYCMENNTKEINIFNNDSDWTADNSTLSDDFGNYRIHRQAIQVLEPNNTAGVCGMYQTLSSTIDLSVFQNGSSSTTADLIVLYCYVSDAAAVNYVELILGDDSTDNYSETWSGLTTGWNVLISARSAFTTNNSPTGWDTIDYIAVNWYSNANYQDDYITFNHCAMIREDPDNSGYYNEFQYYDGSAYQNLFTGNLSQYFLVYCRKFGEILLLRHTPADDETELHLYCECIDFVSKVKMRVKHATDTGNILTWWIDADNYIEIYVTSDTLTLFHREAASNGTETVSMAIDHYDEIEYYIEKTGQTIRLIAKHQDESYVIEYETAISATEEGCIYFGGTSSDSWGLYTDFVFANSQGFQLEDKWDRAVIKVKTQDQTVTNSTVMQTDNELYIQLPANGVFKIELFLIADSASTTPDIDMDWEITGAYNTISFRYMKGPNVATTTVANTNMHIGYYTFPTNAAFGIDGTGNESIIEESFVTQTHKEPVTFQLRWAQNTADPVDTKVSKGSYLIATRLNALSL